MKRNCVVSAVVAWLAATSMWAAVPSVHLTIHDGRVWLVASDATVGQILAEWARVGRTRVVNAERVTGGPLTVQLNGVPEEQALDVLLRSANGYMTALRLSVLPNASQFDRILILPTTTAPAGGGVREAAAPVIDAPPAPVFPPSAIPPVMPGAQRVIGADGLPVPDDQDDPSRPTAGRD